MASNLTSRLIVSLVDGVSGPARAAAGALRGLNSAARSGGSRLVTAQARLGTMIDANNARLSTLRHRLFDAAVVTYGLHRVLTPVVKDAADFETVLEGLGQKADLSGKALGDVGRRIREIGRQTNQSSMGVARGVDFLVGMGLGGKNDKENVDNALAMSPAIGKTSTAYRASFEDIARSAHAVFLNMKVGAGEVQLALDAMAKAGKEGGYELENMAKDFPAITAAAQFTGMAGVSAVADIAAALQVARKGAADGQQAANNLMNFFQKFTLKETVANFKKFGVNIYKELEYARKKGLSPIEHMINVLRKITKNNPDMIAQLFGDKQVLEFLRPMWNGMDEYRRIRAEALQAQGTVEQDFERRMKTAQAAFDRFFNSLENMRISLGTALLPGLTDILDKVGLVVEAFTQWSERHPKLAASLVALTVSLIGLRIAVIALRMAARMAFGGLLMIGYGAMSAVRGVAMLVAAAGGAALAPVIGAFRALRTAMIGFAASASIAGVGPALAIMGRSMLGLLNPMRLVRGALVAVRVALIGTGIGAIAVGLAAAGTWIYNNWSGLKELFGGIADGFKAGLAPVMPILQPFVDLISTVYDKVSGLVGPLSASTSEWRSWGETIGGAVAAGVRSIVSGLQTVVGLFKSAYDGAVWLGNKLSNLWPGGKSSPAPGGASPPGRAMGGNVTRGRAYVVGERRPELFIPGRSGTIHPNTNLGGGLGMSVSLAPVFNIDGVRDPRAVAEETYRLFEARVRDLFRGIQSDVGARFA